MLKNPMGRNDGLLTFAETASRLDVSGKHLGDMIRKGYIRPAKVGRHRHQHLFRTEDVEATVALRRRGADVPKLATIAAQAQALSLSNAAKLDKICAFLGLENNRLHTDEDSIFLLHLKVRETMRLQLSDVTTAAVMEWASTFNGIDEGYLQCVAEYTLDPNPWGWYLELANRLMAAQPAGSDSNIRFAYSCLDSSRRHLRHVSYFYAMTRIGEHLANELFAKDQVDDEIIAQLHPIINTHH